MSSGSFTSLIAFEGDSLRALFLPDFLPLLALLLALALLLRLPFLGYQISFV
jgi:hypothetical protein